MEAFTLAASAGPADAVVHAPRLRAAATAAPPPAARPSVSATGAFAIGTVAGVAALAGARRQGRRAGRASVVKCLATVGDRVSWRGKSGTVKYVGETKFATGEWVGLEMDADGGSHDGTVFGEEYFTCAPGKGAFALASQLTATGAAPAAAAPAVAPAAAPAAAAAPAVAGSGPSSDAVDAAKKDADLHSWAAAKLAAEGSPQAAAMQAKANAKVQTYQQLQSMFDQAQKGMAFAGAASAAPAAAAYSAPAPAAYSAPAAARAGSAGPSREEVAAAKADADLFMWAASTLAAEGHPKAASMRAEADHKASAYQAVQAMFDEAEKGAVVGRGAAPAAPAAPAAAYSPPPARAAAPAVSPASMGMAAAPSKEEVAAAKADADLYVWSANTLAAEGNPKAAAMRATADQKLQAYQALQAMLDSAEKKVFA